MLESLTCLLSLLFLSDFIDVTRPVCLASVTCVEKLAQGSMLAVNEASLACLLFKQINKEKIDFVNKISRDFPKLFLWAF